MTMPPQAGTPKAAGKRVRRSPRNATNNNSPLPNSDNVTSSQEAHTETFQPSQILKRGEPNTLTNNNDASLIDPKQLSAPAQPRPKPRGQKEAQSGNDSALDNPKARRNKNKVSQSKPLNASANENRQNVGPTKSRHTTNTPAPTNRTPSKAYAGPNFHASPAASSLPPPTFLSKSVPNVNKTTSLRNMLEHESSESTSEGDVSPSQRAATRLQDLPVREESPLDVLFRADKEAKARKFQTKDNSMVPNGGSPFGSKLREPNKSPFGPPRTRNHVRHHTDSSAAGVFPLEMDTTSIKPEKDIQFSPPRVNVEPIASSPDLTEERRNAQSLALKRLLNCPQPHVPTLSPVGNVSPLSKSGSPSLESRPGNRSSPRLSGNPPEFPKGLDNSNPDQRRAILLALAEKQIAMPNGQSIQRPTSSSLRQEMRAPDSQDRAKTPDLPSTPTPSRTREKPKPASTKYNGFAPNGHHPTYPAATAGITDRTYNSPNKGNDSRMKFMEDDLRRILKLA